MTWPVVAFALGTGALTLGCLVLGEFRARRVLETKQLAALRTALEALQAQVSAMTEELARHGERLGKLEAKQPDGVLRAEKRLPAIFARGVGP